VASDAYETHLLTETAASFWEMKRTPNHKRGWQRFHFVSPLQGLVCFGGDLPRAALADSLCPGLSYFALSGQRKIFVPRRAMGRRWFFAFAGARNNYAE
jgi:hypothetical protein